MRNRAVKTAGMKFCDGRKGLLLAILFCLQFNTLDARAQEVRTLSEKPYIIQTFAPERNETEVKLFLSIKGISSKNSIEIYLGKDKSNPIRMSDFQHDPTAGSRIQSGVLLDHASYIYEGTTPTGRQGVRFTFYSKRKDTFKDQPSFSIIVDGQAIHEGVAEPPIHLASDEDFKQKILVSVPTNVFLRTARAKKVQFKLGPKVYKPESFQQKSMRALADIIDPSVK